MLFLTKMISFRPQDQADIETLLIANREAIDVGLIRQEWSTVAQGEEGRTAWLEDAIARLVLAPGGIVPFRQRPPGCPRGSIRAARPLPVQDAQTMTSAVGTVHLTGKS
jgi:hypothetical protein